MTKNFVQGILEQRDRLIELKRSIGDDLNRPEFFFYKAQLEELIAAADAAITGKMDTVDMIIIYKEMSEFDP